MIVYIAKGRAEGEVKAPPSKSYAHRYLIAAALSGFSSVSNIQLSKDIEATLNCLKALGFSYKNEFDTVTIKGSVNPTGEDLNCNESGSTLRFLIPIVLATCGKARFTGTKRLFERGLSVYEDIFNEQGINYELGEDYLEVDGHLKAGRYHVATDVSSQFVTGLIFGLSLLKEDSEIELVGKIESEPYIDITIDTLHKFGVEAVKEGNFIKIKGGQKYAHKAEMVEGDYSNAAFLDALNFLKGNVKVWGLYSHSKQGDRVYKDLFAQLALGKQVIDISNCIDLGPILFALATQLHGATFTGIKRLRIKESDRVRDMALILTLFGYQCVIKEDSIDIGCTKVFNMNVTHFKPVNDHRIVMATAILLTTVGGSLENAEAVNKSYPNFFNDLEELGIGVKYETH